MSIWLNWLFQTIYNADMSIKSLEPIKELSKKVQEKKKAEVAANPVSALRYMCWSQVKKSAE